MSNGSNPYVTRVTFKDGQVMLTVQVDEFPPDVSIELSGYAIQNGEVFASFYDIQSVIKNPDNTAEIYVSGTPSQEFKKGVPVTVVLRAARAWISVLTESAEYPGTSEDTTAPVWDKVETVGQVSTALWPKASTSQSSAGDATFSGAHPAGPPG